MCMHSPILRLKDHEHQMENLRTQSEVIEFHMAQYLQEIDANQKRVDNEFVLIEYVVIFIF